MAYRVYVPDDASLPRGGCMLLWDTYETLPEVQTFPLVHTIEVDTPAGGSAVIFDNRPQH